MSSHGHQGRHDDDPAFLHRPTAPGSGQGGGAGPRNSGGTGRKVLLGGILVALAAAVGVVLALTVFKADSDGADAYRSKINASMGDVISANKTVSSSLGRLNTGRSTSAQRAVEQAQTATASARGAVNALTVPDGAEPLAAKARQTLSREAAYLGAVTAALENPASPGADRAETLATNLTDALDVMAPTDADWSQSVSGADNLTAWATRNTREAERAAADRRRRRLRARARAREESPGDSSTGGGTTQNPSGGSAPPASGSDCGDGLRAGPNTSCAFAANVRDAYNEAPGAAATIRVFSPTTNQTYTMSCAPAGSGITCSGGNNASVTF